MLVKSFWQSNAISFVRVMDEAIEPTRATQFAAGFDLHATKAFLLKAHSHALIHTGIRVVLPTGTYGRVAGRSGLALTHGLLCGGGVIDPDYTGPIGVILFNTTNVDFQVHTGMRIAQLICERFVNPLVESPHVKGVVDGEEDEEETALLRGCLGFGSSGMF